MGAVSERERSPPFRSDPYRSFSCSRFTGDSVSTLFPARNNDLCRPGSRTQLRRLRDRLRAARRGRAGIDLVPARSAELAQARCRPTGELVDASEQRGRKLRHWNECPPASRGPRARSATWSCSPCRRRAGRPGALPGRLRAGLGGRLRPGRAVLRGRRPRQTRLQIRAERLYCPVAGRREAGGVTRRPP